MIVQPYPEWPSSGLHFNHSLWSTKTKENVMYDSNQSDNLSDITRWWVAGLLMHAPALMALCCPTVNCYRRLGPGFAPQFADWAIDDRTVTIRVKNYGPKVNNIFNFTIRRYASQSLQDTSGTSVQVSSVRSVPISFQRHNKIWLEYCESSSILHDQVTSLGFCNRVRYYSTRMMKNRALKTS